MEANPESFSADKGRLARAAGVNRLSLGVQSFAAKHLRFLDRAHTGERARAAFDEARAAGFTNVSLDLIFGVPGQTLDEWEQDLQTALSMRPDHLSCYNLTYEPGTRLHRDLAQSRFEANPEESDRSMFLHTRAALDQAGYDAYEISNFAGAGGRCRHNDHYWLQGDYVGVGPGACSHRAGVRTTNIKPLEAWAAAALRGQQPGASAETLTPRQRAGEAIWLGLRRMDGVDLTAVSRRLQLRVRDWFAPLVERLVGDGLLQLHGTRLQLTKDGLLFADRVSGEFLAGTASPSDSESQSIGQHLG
jgi:oxygen-independent coproporphyrinogen-3 oxidase